MSKGKVIARILAPFSGRNWLGASRPIAPPIVQTSLYSFSEFGAFDAKMRGQVEDHAYSRVSNSTVSEFEDMMADLESGEVAYAATSGMAAVSAVLMSQIKPGDRVIAVENVYNDTYRFFEQVLTPFGAQVSYHSVDAFQNDSTIYEGARLAWLESPTSMVFETLDLGKVAKLARDMGTVTVIDNSWATPLLQRPLEHGIDLVVHSASKYLGGHSDLVAGVIIGSADRMHPIQSMFGSLLGAKLAPFDAWLLIRSLRTLDVRLSRIALSAEFIADGLRQSAGVAQLRMADTSNAPSLEGRSGLFSIELVDDCDVACFCDALELFRVGPSWGGFDSLVFPAKAGGRTHAKDHALGRFAVSDQLVRLSIGLEDPDALLADIQQALVKSRIQPTRSTK